MQGIPFREVSNRTLGMEIELQLIDGKTLNLIGAIEPLMEAFADHPHIRPEFNRYTIEVGSKICRSLDGLQRHLLATLRELMDQCRKMGIRLCGAGTHPFFHRMALITELPRFLEHEKSGGLLAHLMVTFSTHLHLGMSDGHQAVQVMRRMRPFLPLLMSLSANSPYWWGEDTRFACFRQRILSMMRNYGLPPAFFSWHAFEHFYEGALRAGMCKDFRDIHWDIRPRPDLGSLEIRVMDSQNTVGESLALAGLVMVMAEMFREHEHLADAPHPLSTMPWWLEKENYFRASRHGLEAELLISESGEVRSAREIISELLRQLLPEARRLGVEKHFSGLFTLLEQGPGYRRQRQMFAAQKSLASVVDMMCTRLEAELAGSSIPDA